MIYRIGWHHVIFRWISQRKKGDVVKKNELDKVTARGSFTSILFTIWYRSKKNASSQIKPNGGNHEKHSKIERYIFFNTTDDILTRHALW